MSASSGPVNWELARQVGVANAVEAGPDLEPTEGDLRMLEEAVRVAELQVGRFTGLPAPADVAQVRAVRRAGWVNANTESLKSLLEPAARRLTDADRAELGRATSAGDGAGLGVPASAFPSPARHPGGPGPRDARAAGARSVRHRAAEIRPRTAPVRRPEPRGLRTRLVPRPEGVPDARGAARGDPPVRVRSGMGQRPVPGAPRRLPVDAETGRRRDAGSTRLTRPGRPGGAPAARRVRRGPLLGGPRRRTAPEAREDPGLHGGRGGLRRPCDAGAWARSCSVPTPGSKRR